MSAAEIAEAISSDASYVERLMYACASIGVFKLGVSAQDGEPPRFVNTRLSAVLRESHPNSMRALVGSCVENSYKVWGRLAEVFEHPEGPIAWELEYPEHSLAEGGIWHMFETDPHAEAQFARAMTSLDGLGAGAMVADGPFAKFDRFIDVGGGRGHFLHHVLEAHPSAIGVVFDRENVIETATAEAWGPQGPFATAAPRVKLVSGSFFVEDSIPAARDGDAFYMRYILHDWPPEDCLTILKSVRTAIGQTNATLLIGEVALPDRGTVGQDDIMYKLDMEMMVLTRGQERTPTQWKEILTLAGFKIIKFHPTRSIIHWVEAVPI